MQLIADIFSFIFKHFFLINILLAILIVFFERKKPTSTWLWLMVLVFLPIIGFILYLFIGQDIRKQKIFTRKWQADIAQGEACQFMETSVYPHDTAQDYPDIVRLHCNNGVNLWRNNDVKLFHDGKDKFAALLESLAQAKEYIHIEYYIFRDDNLGRQVIQTLAERAAAGVEVKLLYDGMGGLRLPRRYFRPLIEAGGKVACFLPPFLPYINLRVNYRNHRKICIIDGVEAWIGGFNIGDEYLGLSKRFGYWRDTHMRIRGGAVRDLQWRFILDWQFAAGETIRHPQRYFPAPQVTGNTSLQIVSSGPDSRWSEVKDGYFKLITDARHSLYIHTPYFIPDDSIFDALRIAALSGVDVRVIIPGIRDHPFVWWASLSYIGTLLKAGVRCYVYKKGFMHSKVVVADAKVSSVGTANMDIRSFDLNFEVNAFIYDKTISRELHERFLMDLADCEEITREIYSKLPASVRIRESISRLLSPLL
jgi:cardiolipin synthase